MPVVAMGPSKQRSRFSVAFTSSARVLFTTLLFTAGGMGLGLFLGIIGMTVYALLHGGKVDMAQAYRHVAFPIALSLGALAFCGAIYLEVRSHRTK
jgi:hypothetical protein